MAFVFMILRKTRANGQLSLVLARKSQILRYFWRKLAFFFRILFVCLAFGICGIAQADTKPNSDPYKVGIKKPKTGAFVGGEIGFGSAYSYASISLYTGRNLQGELTGATYAGYYSNWNDYTAIPLNVFGGYQWYFYDRPWFHFGVRVHGHIGYSNYNTKMSDYNSLYSANVDFALNSHAIQYGVEAQFLWDFLKAQFNLSGFSLIKNKSFLYKF